MKAAVFHAHGPIENLAVEDWPAPEPGPRDCLIRVEAVALNGFDPMILAGIPGLKTPLPMIPGADIAGTIVACGAEVDGARWRPGARVLVIPNRPDGMMGETLRGGACELIAVDQDALLPLPDAVGAPQAACLPVAYGAARRMMVARGRVAAGETVLVLGASGGVGTACVQLAKAAGAEVIACAGGAWKGERLKALGADHVIDSTTQDFVAEVWRLRGKPSYRHGGGGVDVVVNYTGGESWARSLRVLTRHGRLLTCGATAGYDPATDIRYIWSFELAIIGSNGWEREDLIALLKMVAAGDLDPVIHARRPLAEIGVAMRELVDRQVFGKQVLEP